MKSQREGAKDAGSAATVAAADLTALMEHAARRDSHQGESQGAAGGSRTGSGNGSRGGAELPPAEYLAQEIFPTLLPGIEKLLKTVNLRGAHGGASAGGGAADSAGASEGMAPGMQPNVTAASLLALQDEPVAANSPRSGRSAAAAEHFDPIVWLAQYLYRTNPNATPSRKAIDLAQQESDEALPKKNTETPARA